jgi:type I restriction enzyme, S subunit
MIKLNPEVEKDNTGPQEWKMSQIGDLVEVKYGKGLLKGSRNPKGVPVYGSNGIIGQHEIPLTKGATIIVGRKGTVGAVHLSEVPCWPIDTTYFIDEFKDLDPKFFLYVLRSKSLSSLDTSTAIPGLNREELYKQEIPVPPFEEQKRIVAKIEELLPKINAVRERLIRVKEIMKRFRQSVLSAACSGRLSEDWRNLIPVAELEKTSDATQDMEKRKAGKGRAGRLWGAGVIPDLTEEELNSLPATWTWVTVRDLGDNPEDAVQVGPMSMRSRDFTDFGVPVLNVGCVQWGHFDESKLDHMPQSLAAKFQRYRISRGDILFTRSGTVGRCSIATEAQEGYLMTFHLLRVRTAHKKCLPEYLQIVFQGAPHIHRQTEEGAIGSTRAGFNTNLLAGLSVPLPPLLEQREIVRRVESLLAVSGNVEKRIDAELSRTEKMTQAILAKAFRGELVPNETDLSRREVRVGG